MSNGRHVIMVIDDHPIIHDGIKILLAGESDLEIACYAPSASDAMEKLEGGLPDIAITDLSLGDSDGTYLIQRMHAKYPKLKILVYTMSEEKIFAERAAYAGASGYVMKTSPPATLQKAIHKILAGEKFFSPAVMKKIENKSSGRTSGSHGILDTLSNREMDVFKLIGEGLNSIQISEKLDISRNTVDTHRINIKNKLDLPNGKALERLAFKVIQQKRMP